MWVRGLKLIEILKLYSHLLSHPMWVRGLKLISNICNSIGKKSHPMWVRGLKPKSQRPKSSEVESHPMWVRGLKRITLKIVHELSEVAPYVGAWIETVKFGCKYTIK